MTVAAERRGWAWWAWSTLVVAVVVTLLLDGWVLLWLSFGAQSTYPGDVARVVSAARTLVALVAVPWLLATLLVRPRGRVAVAAVVCVAPALAFWLDARPPEPWF